jgi:hypothetical protein
MGSEDVGRRDDVCLGRDRMQGLDTPRRVVSNYGSIRSSREAGSDRATGLANCAETACTKATENRNVS